MKSVFSISNDGLAPLTKSAGFSLFELVVFIILAGILYAEASNRFAEFPAEAERANFFATTTQLQSALTMEMMLDVAGGQTGAAEQLVGVNPMNLLLQAPSNYLGAFTQIEQSQIERRSWYFDSVKGELVYLVNSDDRVALLVNGAQILTNEIRFRVVAVYGDDYSKAGSSQAESLSARLEDNRSAAGANSARGAVVRKLNGLLLQPVTAFQWRSGNEQAMLEATSTG